MTYKAKLARALNPDVHQYLPEELDAMTYENENQSSQ
jgi:hypothetical protein